MLIVWISYLAKLSTYLSQSRRLPPLQLVSNSKFVSMGVQSQPEINAPRGCAVILFKNASAFLLRDARHAMHDILLLRISAILPEAISDVGLTPTTDTDLLLATYRGGSHLTSDILSSYTNVKNDAEVFLRTILDIYNTLLTVTIGAYVAVHIPIPSASFIAFTIFPSPIYKPT